MTVHLDWNLSIDFNFFVYLVRISTGVVCISLDLLGTVMPDIGSRLAEYALKIEDLYIVPWSLDQVTGDLITSLNFVIDSPVSQVQQDTSRCRG